MKNLGIFYLILVVLLSALPCSDELEGHELNVTSIANIQEGKQQGSTESCSPICLCVCCGQSIVAPQFIDFELEMPIVLAKKVNTFYEYALLSGIHQIWQPPKLS